MSKPLDSMEIYERGLNGLSLLKGEERFVFMLQDFDNLMEMEGWFHFCLNDHYFMWYFEMKNWLATIGDQASIAVLEDFENHLKKHRVKLKPSAIEKFWEAQEGDRCPDWTNLYGEHRGARWRKAIDYLKSQGFELTNNLATNILEAKASEYLMGTWGVLAFDNDEACDWAYDLEGTNDLSLIVAAFAEVGEAEDYLDAATAGNALAACEVLARLLGNFGYRNSYTEKVDSWVEKHPMQPPKTLLVRAGEVIDRILGENSELNELWQEGDAAEWIAAVRDLQNRLNG